MLATITLFASTSTFVGFIIWAIRTSNDFTGGAIYGPSSSAYHSIDSKHLQKLTDTLNSVAVVTLGVNVRCFLHAVFVC